MVPVLFLNIDNLKKHIFNNQVVNRDITWHIVGQKALKKNLCLL